MCHGSLASGHGIRLLCYHGQRGLCRIQTLHQCALLLKSRLNGGERVGDGHCCLELGDDLHIVAHLYAEQLAGTRQALEARRCHAHALRHLVEEAGVAGGVADRCLHVGHCVLCLSCSLRQLLDALGQLLTKWTCLLLVSQSAIGLREGGQCVRHLAQLLLGAGGHGVHLAESLHELKHAIVEVLKRTASVAAFLGVLLYALRCSFYLLVVLLGIDLQSEN